jgi:hypothetical protein
MGRKEGLKRDNETLFNEGKERSGQLEELTNLVQKAKESARAIK